MRSRSRTPTAAMISIHLWLLILLEALLSNAPPAAAQESLQKTIQVYVSIPPQAYFVERVGGSHVTVEVLVAPGLSPETYEPTSRQMTQLAQADVYFHIGFPFEQRLLDKIHGAVKELRAVDTREGITLRHMTDSHAEGEPDPHTWLDPHLAAIQAATICKELSRLDSAHAAEYRTNLKMFQADLDSLNARIAELLAPLKNRKFYVFHPSFGYFADAYGLTEVPVEIEGKEPSARQLAALIDSAHSDNVNVLFVQPQISTRQAETIANAIGATVIPLDPLSRDYLENLKDMATKIAQALR